MHNVAQMRESNGIAGNGQALVIVSSLKVCLPQDVADNHNVAQMRECNQNSWRKHKKRCRMSDIAHQISMRRGNEEMQRLQHRFALTENAAEDYGRNQSGRGIDTHGGEWET